MDASQSYTTNPAGFVWDAKFKIARLPLLRIRDKYELGKGYMFGKLLGIVTIIDMKGDELDQGAMVRYLNEIMWFPTAYLSENISWKELDDYTVQAIYTEYGKSVTAQIFIDEAGRMVNFTAKRYREAKGEFSLDTWSTPITAYADHAGLKLPSQGTAMWKLSTGDLRYIEFKLTEIEYNRDV